MYGFHILACQAANGGQNYKQKKCTFHNHNVLKVKLRIMAAKITAGCSITQDIPVKFNIF